MSNNIQLYKNDLPDDLNLGNIIAVDGEFMGLNVSRDPLCLIQLSSGNSDAHIVQFDRNNYNAPNLVKILNNEKIVKIFHYGRADMAHIKYYLKTDTNNILDTKIASKLARTYSDRHGLKDLCRELLKIDISKQQQTSDWGAEELTAEQADYAAGDVLYLHRIRAQLDAMLARENRTAIAEQCFAFLPTRARLDLDGFAELDIFHH